MFKINNKKNQPNSSLSGLKQYRVLNCSVLNFCANKQVFIFTAFIQNTLLHVSSETFKRYYYHIKLITPTSTQGK